MLLSVTERRTLTNVQRLVRSLGNTPLAQNLDALVARLAPSVGSGGTIAGYAGSDASQAPSTYDDPAFRPSPYLVGYLDGQRRAGGSRCGCPLGAEHVCDDWSGALAR